MNPRPITRHASRVTRHDENMSDYRRILIIKPSSLGDVVHALPTLAALRQTFPHAPIAWVVQRQGAALVERVEGREAVGRVDGGVRGWVRGVARRGSGGVQRAVDF